MTENHETENTRFKLTKFGLHATDKEIAEQIKEKLTVEEYAWIKQSHKPNQQNVDRNVDLLVKAGIVERVPST